MTARKRHAQIQGRSAGWEARLILAATFPLFLAAALASRLSRLAGAGSRAPGSPLKEARSAARQCAAFAFMG